VSDVCHFMHGIGVCVQMYVRVHICVQIQTAGRGLGSNDPHARVDENNALTYALLNTRRLFVILDSDDNDILSSQLFSSPPEFAVMSS
jgi:hypothetical protein